MSKLYIQRKTVAELPKATGSVSDTLNVEDKVTNAPSINLVTKLSGIPEEGIIAYEGDEIPEGYEEVSNPNVYSTEEVKTNEVWIDEDGNEKPVYRKVIVQDLTETPTILSIPSGIDVIDVRGRIESKYANAWLIPNHPYNSNNEDPYHCDLFMTSGSIYMELGTSMYGTATTTANIKLIIEYTKTTD